MLKQDEINFKEFIANNEKLIWSVVNNKGNKYFDNSFYNVMTDYYTKNDLYQECLTKIFSVFKDLDEPMKKEVAYFVTVCKNHLITIIQPLRAEKHPYSKTTGDYDMNNICSSPIYSDFESRILEDAYEIIEEYEYGYIVKMVLSGMTQGEVGNAIGKSRQFVNKKYNEFIRRTRRELL